MFWVMGRLSSRISLLTSALWRTWLAKSRAQATPGHGEKFADTPARIREYVEHRRKREREVIEVLGRGPSNDEQNGWTTMDIVKVIYKDVPENLHLPAARGIVQILDKLVGEGKAVHSEEQGTWTLSDRASI